MRTYVIFINLKKDQKNFKVNSGFLRIKKNESSEKSSKFKIKDKFLRYKKYYLLRKHLLFSNKHIVLWSCHFLDISILK
jgi:hypothetical protein